MKFKLIHPAHINGEQHQAGDEVDVDKATFDYLQFASLEIRRKEAAQNAADGKLIAALTKNVPDKEQPQPREIPGLGAAKPQEKNLAEKDALDTARKA